jgi:undecaprenyl-diphosphatase
LPDAGTHGRIRCQHANSSEKRDLFDGAHDRGVKAITLSRVDPINDISSTLNQVRDRRLLVGLLALLICVFLQISVEMLEGQTRAFDISTLRSAQALRVGRPWLAEALRDLSGLGSTSALVLMTVSSVGYLVVVRERTTALLTALAVCTGSIGVSLLKTYFGRPRPDARFAELVVSGMSFPSGHAANSTIVLLTIAALLASNRTRVIERLYILAVASLLAVFVGLSRIALGVHWATDVAAGWSLGAFWAIVWLLVAHRVNRPTVDLPDAVRMG